MRHHVWVDQGVSRGDTASPGLLLEWRQDKASAWQGRVIMLDRRHKGEPFDRVIVLWLPAHCLTPVLSGRPT